MPKKKTTSKGKKAIRNKPPRGKGDRTEKAQPAKKKSRKVKALPTEKTKPRNKKEKRYYILVKGKKQYIEASLAQKYFIKNGEVAPFSSFKVFKEE